MKTDNRWPVGSLEEKIPADAVAVYSARWIDQSDNMDVVPDRQGFAYDDPADRDRLIRMMELADLRSIAVVHDHSDDPIAVGHGADRDFHAWLRRTGGYCYVAAWIA